MPDIKGIAGAQLKSFIERIERLEDEKRALGEDTKEVYAKQEHDEQETLLDLYKRALNMVPESGPSAEAAE